MIEKKKIIFLCSSVIYTLNLALLNVIIVCEVRNFFSDEIEYNHYRSILLSLSEIPLESTIPFNYGRYVISSKIKGSYIDSYGMLRDKFDIEQTDIFVWKGKKLYTNKSEMSYLSLINNSVSKGEQCKEGYKQCGILDTVGNILCFPYTLECPINDIIMTNSLSIPNQFKEYNHNSIQINENTVLHYTNEAINKPIIVDFRLSKKMPCLKNALDDCDTNKGDRRFKVLDKMNLYTFYEINDLFSYDKKVDRADNKLKKKDVYLYYREYIGFDKNCIENDKRFFMKSKFFEKNITVRKLVIIPYFFSILAFLVFLCLHDREGKKRLFMIPSVAFIIILLIIPYIISIKIPPITSCSDEYTTTLVDIILNKKKMHQVYILILICFNSALFLLVIFCSEVLLSFISNCKEKPTKPSISTNKFFKKIKTIDDIHFHIVSFIILQDGRIAVQGKYQIRIYNPDKNYKCENIIKDNNEMIKICQIDNGFIISLHEDNSIKKKQWREPSLA